MKNTKSIFCLFLAFIIVSCDRTWNISELYLQRIEDSPKVIYKYSAWGGRDAQIHGYVILDSTQVFDINNLEPLQFNFLQATPKNKYILTVDDDNSEFDKMSKENFEPIKTQTSVVSGIKIITTIFKTQDYQTKNQGLERYQFETFRETSDSIFFFNLIDIESIKPKRLDSLKFKKTNVYLKQKVPNVISMIIVQDLKLSNDRELISNIQYRLTPKNKTYFDSFSNVGIFKEIKK